MSAVGFISDAWADDWLAIVMQNDTTKALTDIEVGLSLTLPTDRNGAGLTLPDDVDYARVSVALDATHWESAGVGSRQLSNALAITFVAGSVDWPSVQCYTFYDSADRYLGYGPILPYTVLAGDAAVFNPNTVVLNMPYVS